MQIEPRRRFDDRLPPLCYQRCESALPRGGLHAYPGEASMETLAAALATRFGGPLRGRVKPPGDKSISHRALILGLLCVGETEIAGLLEGADVLHTAAACASLRA